ncbi:IS3 family transposase [Rhodococcus sp. AQ5-07]|uniref:IS3 family transposase n=1 Tax=Rhodococcus sp. AQ5-07 TaxID=2054902 RepID=UPI003FA3A4D5
MVPHPETRNSRRVSRGAHLRWWNTTRIQQRLGYLSPDEYRAQKPSIACGLTKESNFRGPLQDHFMLFATRRRRWFSNQGAGCSVDRR